MSRWLTAVSLLVLVACGGDDSPSGGKNTNNTNNTVEDAGMDTASDAGNTNNTNGDMGIDTDADMGAPGCDDECAAGEQVCDDTTAYRTCGQYDTDACLELSPVIGCAQGYICETDRCVPPCRDECPVGGTICVDNDTVSFCGNFDADICREAGAPIDCSAGERCEQGACVDAALPCTDECTTDGEAACFGDATRVCGDFDSDSCLDLGAPVACGLGQQCSAGQCVSFCSDECSTDGVTECAGDGVRTCSDANNDGCLEWSPTVACAASTFCSQGVCVGTCIDECASAGAAVCTPDGQGVSLCGQYDGDVCLDRASGVPCPAGFSCSNGLCVASCTNDCNPGAAPQCAVNGSALQTCGNFDNDPCYEWGGDITCPGGAACSAGSCEIPCTDECTAGQAACNATDTGFTTCGQWDVDSCLEFSQETACQSYEVCNAGVCELGGTPYDIVINEILVNSIGNDSQSGNLLFIELHGPANAGLDGYTIAGVNGSDGSTYTSISLNGEVLGADGYFVIAHPASAPELLAVADLTDARVDFQNGPDSVQLKWRSRVVDAVGYGSFGANDIFAGEGTAVAAAPDGQSLSRDASHTDTDNNSADFVALAVPTPREMTATCADDCTGNETRCTGGQIESCGNYDSDNCSEWGPAMACANAGDTCVGTTCQPPCSNECPQMGDTQCAGQQVSTCGNYDADACVEWSVPAACPGAQVCIANACQDPTAPEVVLISPQGTLQTTQGNTHRILVDATPYAGRTIASVKYYANNVEIGTTTATPHEFYYTVPANHPTNSQIVIQAKAQDSLGFTGSSAFAYLDVKNDAPMASFTATITNTTTVAVDASASSDTETAGADLEVCWDWDNNGTCDTAFSKTKIMTHDFSASGTYTVRMVVRDAVGQTAEATRQVSFADIQYLGGSDVTTTLWYGTIVVTGDITVPAGNTLTIAEGTNILFVYADVDTPANVGDYRITVDGNMIVNGTAANPVVFSGQGAPAKKKGGWDSIVLNGAGSVINHAIIEYGDVALEAKSDAELNNVEVRQASSDCIRLNNADNASLTSVQTHDCAKDGVAILGGSTGVIIDDLASDNNGQHGLSDAEGSSISVMNSVLKDNAVDGAFVTGSSTAFNLSDSIVETNDHAGIRVGGNSTGTITQNQIRQNAAEGVSLLTEASGSPAVVVQYNNIYSNALQGSSEVTLDTINISASQACCSTSTSATFTAPANTFIRRVYVSYDEGTDRYSQVRGELVDQNDALLKTYASDSSGWVYMPEGVTGVYVQVTDSGAHSDIDTISVSQVEYVGQTGSYDVVAATDNNTVDLRYNYLGVFPNVLSRVSLARTSALNLHGFVGVAFGPTFDTGPYKAGPVGGQTWSGTIYITGDVTIPADEVLTVTAGTQVLFVNHDQDMDTNGDFSMTALGAMNVNGSVGNVVRFAGYGSVEADMFQTINLDGSTTNASAWTDVLIENAKTGVTLRGDSALTRVESHSDSGNAFDLLSGSGASMTRCVADGGAADGLYINGASNVTVSRLMSRNHTGNGVAVFNNSTATIEDSTIRDNGLHGIKIERASPALNYNLITYNGGEGIWINNLSSPTITYSIIKFNGGAGLAVWTGASGSATPTANYNNIYSNAVTGNTKVLTTTATISASQACCSTSSSSLFTAPANHTIRRVYVSYDEGTDRYSQVSGWLVDQNDALLKTYTRDSSGWVYMPEGVTGVYVRVTDSGANSDIDTISVSQAEMTTHDPMSVYELYAATEAGTSNAKFNYWTPDIANVPTKIYQAQAGSVDYSGFTGAEYPSGAVTQIGPRP